MADLNLSSRKAGGKNATKKMPVRVDLTAMVDLAFLLITFFMLTTSLIKPRAMPVAMPTNDIPGPVSDKTTMSIDLGKNNKMLYYLGQAEHPIIAPQIANDEKELRTAVLETRKQVSASTGKSMFVIIKPSDRSVYANLVDALDELNITNTSSYAIAATQPADINLLKQKGIY